MARITVAGLLFACGSAALADVTPAMSPDEPRSGARVMGHFYINMATGEVIASAEPVARPRGLGQQVWIADNDIPCAVVDAAAPYTVSFVAIHDDPARVGDPNWGEMAYFAYFKNCGDVPSDTVIDMLQVSTFADHPDTDADGDGMGDGVEGLAAEWLFLEADNGFNDCRTVTGIMGFRLENIPGNLTPGAIEGYVYTIDLVGGLATDLSFEIGDTDGNRQGAAIHNPWGNANGTMDRDGDGLVDFSYSIRYLQPGTLVGVDGNPIGDPTNRARTYSALSAPRMNLAAHPPTAHTVLPISAGSEDRFDVILDPNGDGNVIFFATLWYGGFTCDRDGDGVFEGDLNGSDANNDGIEDNDYRPYASFFMAMYGPGEVPPCPADFYPPPAGDGVLNFFDLSYFIARYGENDPVTDFFPPGGDGVLNFFDVVAYINAFNAGCP